MIGLLRVAALAALLSVAGQAAGQTSAQIRDAKIRALKIETCEGDGDTARRIMSHRQSGTSMAALVARISKAGAGDSEMLDYAMPMIIAAYEEPRYGTEKQQQRTIRDFENDAFLKCMKTIK